jgi:hypothetical protein
MGMDIEQLKAQRDALDAQINKARMEKLRAWEQGHAYGYSEVETHYGELAQLARKLLAWQRSA